MKGPFLTKKPKLMLIQYNITSSSRQEETCIKVSISKKHSQSCCKNRKTPNQLDTNKTQRPYKQRQTVQSHTLSTHVCYSNLEIDRSQNTSNTNNVQAKNSQVNRSSRMTQCTTKRRICCPAYTGALFYQSTKQHQDHPHRQYPKTNVIHSWKPHVRPSNHNRNLPIPKSSHQRRHYYKEQHQLSVSCNQYVIKLTISCQNTRTCTPLFHTNHHTHGGGDHTSPPGKYKVHHTNIFGISTTKPSNKQLIPFIGRIFHTISIVVLLYYSFFRYQGMALRNTFKCYWDLGVRV